MAAASGRKLVPVPRHPGIYRRGGGYVVRYRDPQGKQCQEAAKTLAEARAIRSVRTADVVTGEFSRLSRDKFIDYGADWLASYKGRTRRGIRPETIAGYARELGYESDGDGGWRPIEPAAGAVAFFGRRLLTEITPRDIKRYAAEVEKRGVKPNTVRLAIAPLKALLATAVEEHLIRWNPAAGVRFTNQAEAENENGEAEEHAKALSPDELAALLANVPAEWQLLVRFLAHTGLRISEALGLQWGDVEFGEEPKIHVRRRLVAGRLAPPKSRYGKRTLRLSPQMSRALWVLRGKDSTDRSPEAPVFQRKSGSQLDRHRAFHVVKEAARKAGVPWAALHTLRHTCATTLFRNGWNAKQVQHWLGHHSPAFTLATYVHLLPEDIPDATFLDEAIPAPQLRADRAWPRVEQEAVAG